ncbi:Rho GTPase activation protein [Thamnocephalis sphaerospora]|uniref:Rho GTPase activation protein n=1 Tax=Thamnocephalis sphaerospora TaxID=78915 RepID=A0A4V1IWR6_9FUNG|nr:Rho GTPase activation protein [Thamnocephalis sphaerospora]|eukprot:RKP08489.1 Rho GTPase activation protein [Thamnocephalis sphaerospora]
MSDEERDPLVQTLCHADNGLPMLLERAKQTVFSCKDLLGFFRKRAVIEEEYGKSLMKLAAGSAEFLDRPDRKQFSYRESMATMMRAHETIGQNHVKLAAAISDIAEGLNSLLKDTDRARKSLREMGLKFERALGESIAAAEKARMKYDSCSEEWERTLLQRSINDSHGKKPGSNPLARFKARTPNMMNKSEEEARMKTEIANEQYKAQLALANTVRHDYFNTNMPLVLQALMEALEECDYGMQYFLAKYAFNVESLQLSDASTIAPTGKVAGLRSNIDVINNKSDMKNFVVSVGLKGDENQHREDIPYAEYPMSDEARSILNPRPIFGVDLSTQVQRDGCDVPPILKKCIAAIEQHGLMSEGIYRLSGPTSQLRLLKAELDRDCDLVDMSKDGSQFDVNAIAGILKLYLRELPEPLLTKSLNESFIKAAAADDLGSMRSCVQRLPGANQRTLRYLIAHLCRVRDYEAHNRMSANNIAIVFGPTITTDNDTLNPMIDIAQRARVVEMMLLHHDKIFG